MFARSHGPEINLTFHNSPYWCLFFCLPEYRAIGREGATYKSQEKKGRLRGKLKKGGERENGIELAFKVTTIY